MVALVGTLAWEFVWSMVSLHPPEWTGWLFMVVMYAGTYRWTHEVR